MSVHPMDLAGLISYAREQRLPPTAEELGDAASQGQLSDEDVAHLIAWAEQAIGQVSIAALTGSARPLAGVFYLEDQCIEFSLSGLIQLLEVKRRRISLSSLAYTAMASVFLDRSTGHRLVQDFAAYASRQGIDAELFDMLVSTAPVALTELARWAR